MLPPSGSSLHLSKWTNELLDTKTPGAVDDQCRSSVRFSPLKVRAANIMFTTATMLHFSTFSCVSSTGEDARRGGAPRLRRCCGPDHSVRCVRRPEESVGLQGPEWGGVTRGSQRLRVGCRLWGGVQPLIQWKRQCWGVGSVTRLCTEKEGEGPKVYVQKVSGLITADSSGLPPACQQRGGDRLEVLTHWLQIRLTNNSPDFKSY